MPVIQLFTLGTTDLRTDDGAPAHSFLSGSKRFALLAYLALAHPRGFQRRDTILGLFWPDSDQKRARGSLRGLLHQVRRALGDEVIVNRGDEEIGIAEGAVWCDVVEFEAALQHGRLREALQLYRGDLLEGFFVPDAAPAFEHWLDAERVRLRRRAAEAAWTLAEEEEALGNPDGAAYWGRRAVSITPMDEAAARRLIRTLDRVGNRAGALQAYEEFAARLREEFEVEPSRDTRALLQALRGQDGSPQPDATEAAADGEEPAPARVDAAAFEAGARAAARQPAGAAPDAQMRSWKRPPLLLLAGLACAVILTIAMIRMPMGVDRSAGAGLEESVAVLPFRVSGADPSLGYLREGMVDLLATTLTGDVGPRALDPRTVLGAWQGAASSEEADLSRHGAVALAERLGARRLLLGSIVGAPERLVVTAALLDVPSGRTAAEATVQGPADSLSTLVDRLTAALLSLDAGEEHHRIASLTSTSLPALQAYLEAQRLFRHGRYEESSRHYARALDLDSTFALAGYGLFRSANWTAAGNGERGSRIAWAERDRLSLRDRTLVTAWLGPRYPEPSPVIERIEAWKRAVEVLPERAEVWFGLGDVYFHWGRWIGDPHWRSRAVECFGRAIALDSTYTQAIQHLVPVLLAAGDVQAAERFATLYLAQDSVGETADAMRWEVAIARGDTARSARIRGRFGEMNTLALGWIHGTAQLEGVALDDAAVAAEELWRRAEAPVGQRLTLQILHHYELNRGRPSTALAALDRLEALGGSSFHGSANDFEPLPAVHDSHLRVLGSLYGDGDERAATDAARELAALTGRDAPSGPRDHSSALDLCVLEQWRLRRGDRDRVDGSIRRLREVASAEGGFAEAAGGCALLLEALRAAEEGRPNAPLLVERLDSLLRTGPVVPADFRMSATLALAHMYERLGDPRSALEVVRRRTVTPHATLFLSSFLEAEGRLAASLGEREEAARAYRHYLALRSDPEPALRGEVERVRSLLADLSRRARKP